MILRRHWAGGWKRAALSRTTECRRISHVWNVDRLVSTWFPSTGIRTSCLRALLDIWRLTGQPTAPDEIDHVIAQATTDAGLHGEALLAALNDAAAVAGEGTPTEATERYLATLELQATGTEEPGIWSAQALERVRDWAGTGRAATLSRPGKRADSSAACKWQPRSRPNTGTKF